MMMLLGAFAISAVASIIAPTLCLGLFPLVLGFPHLSSSAMTVRERVESQSKDALFVPFFFATWIVEVSARLFLSDDLGASYPLFPEIVCLSILLGGLSFIAGKKISGIGVGVVFLLLLALAKEPVVSTAVLLLLHNFVAFIFWFNHSTGTGSRKQLFAFAGCFLLLNALIWAGAFDSFNLKAFALGSDFASIHLPLSQGWKQVWIDRYIRLYAFGQAVHYVIWLVVLPGGLLTLRNTTALTVVALGTVGLFMAWILESYSLARVLYFSIATFHVYFEILVLLVFKTGSSGWRMPNCTEKTGSSTFSRVSEIRS